MGIDQLILHITTRDRAEIAQRTGVYRADSLDTEGFIHCSTQDQVIWVANQFYAGQRDLVLLCIDPQKVNSEIRYEAVEGVGTFPHIYGELNADAIVKILDFPPHADETFLLPNNL
ncbi:DUF952 domain-containing protein [Leptolyngbya boryana CZ1]|uniref:DUF952 domain-containing protein n=1 Tax=Leptolyngbya boryana CZ1 TaxID=3060204 RepID=A0AA97ARG3_LEPBY|nr:DUF952 domain-containing protein [Leptolyngbya boryana]WNZ47437.1 DUF952 domain-containing protein [Leptolyngbya boryana CZ1]